MRRATSLLSFLGSSRLIASELTPIQRTSLSADHGLLGDRPLMIFWEILGSWRDHRGPTQDIPASVSRLASPFSFSLPLFSSQTATTDVISSRDSRTRDEKPQYLDTSTRTGRTDGLEVPALEAHQQRDDTNPLAVLSSGRKILLLAVFSIAQVSNA